MLVWPKRNIQDRSPLSDAKALKLSLTHHSLTQLISAGWVLIRLKFSILDFPGSTA